MSRNVTGETAADATGAPVPAAGSSPDDRDREELRHLVAFIRNARGVDLGAYRHVSLTRRLRKRMREVGVTGYLDYRDLLETDSDEFAVLFDTLFINVTEFFRDESAWSYLRREIVPAIVAQADPGDEIRVWSAGCATGEEAYTLAMVFAEVLGVAGYLQRVKIYGTDIDEDALGAARAGSYPAEAVERVPAGLRARYFETDGRRFTVRADLRRRVIFGRHDLTRDTPISRLALICCRNTLMYFNSDVQSQILARFHAALLDHGVLFLGPAETLLGDGRRFEPVNPGERIFRRRRVTEPLARYPLAPAAGAQPRPAPEPVPRARDEITDLVVDAAPLSVIVIDNDGLVASINSRARRTFGLSPRDVGRPFHDLEVSYRPTELRAPVEQARAERRPVRVEGVAHRAGADEAPQYVDITVVPLVTGDGRATGTALYAADATTTVRLWQELQQTRDDLTTSYEELQSANEELETTNGELQSSIEGLEATNEELQATNRELEATNEELRASNDELARTNAEARASGAELYAARGMLECILSAIATGVVVLDADMRVRRMNPAAQRLCGVGGEQAQGLPLDRLGTLPVPKLREVVGECLSTGRRTPARTLTARSPEGRTATCSVVCVPMAADEPGVVVLVDEAGGSGAGAPTDVYGE